MERLAELAMAIAWINALFFVIFVLMLFEQINDKNFEYVKRQAKKNITILSIVAIILDVIWLIIGLYAKIPITGPIVLIVFWILMII